MYFQLLITQNLKYQSFQARNLSCHLQSKISTFQIFFLDFSCHYRKKSKISQINLKRKSIMLVFQIVNDKKVILEKNLKRKFKMTILGLDDQGHTYLLPSSYKKAIYGFLLISTFEKCHLKTFIIFRFCKCKNCTSSSQIT